MSLKYHIFPKERKRLLEESVRRAIESIDGPVGFYEDWLDEKPLLTITEDSLNSWRPFCKAVWEDKSLEKKCNDDYQVRAEKCEKSDISTCWLGVHNAVCSLKDNSSGKVTLIGGEFHVKEQKKEAEKNLEDFLATISSSRAENLRKLWLEIPELTEEEVKRSILRELELAGTSYILAINQLSQFRYEENQVSHDLLIMLQSLIGNVEILKIELKRSYNIGRKWEDRFEEIIRTCERHANYLGTHLGNLGNPEFNYHPFGPLIYECIELYKPKARKRGIEIRPKLDKVMDDDSRLRVPDIKMARDYLSRAFSNILDNAIKYSFEGTAEHPRWVDLSGISDVRQNIPGYSIEISNLGIGIESDEIEKVFDPGYQGRRRLGEMRPGFGMGLSFVKECIEMHEGTVNITSIPSRDAWLTTLHIWLPIFGPRIITEASKNDDNCMD